MADIKGLPRLWELSLTATEMNVNEQIYFPA